MLFRLILDELIYRASTLVRRRAGRNSPVHGIVAPLDDIIGQRLFATGWFERTQFGALKLAIENSDFLNFKVDTEGVFIDVGANIGLYTVAFGGSFKSVLSIEANPLTANVLKANLALKNIDNAKVAVEGASDKESHSKIYVPRNGNLGWGTLDLAHFSDDRLAFDIKTRKVDDIFSEHYPSCNAALIKIDVEGHETSVLRGAAATLKRDRPLVLFEALSKAELEANVPFLKSLGYVRFVEFKRNLFGKPEYTAVDVSFDAFQNAALICAIPQPELPQQAAP